MSTTPLWVPLVVAFVAVLGTLGGVVFTQMWNSRLEARRSALETERLREAQAREDLNRTYEHRRAAYVDFLKAFDLLRTKYTEEHPKAYPTSDIIAFINLRTAVTVYGTFEADALSFHCLMAAMLWVRDTTDKGDEDQMGKSRSEYLLQIRKDLGVPEYKPADAPIE